MRKKNVDEALMLEIARRLKDIRNERGITQQIVIMDTDHDIGKIERGLHGITVNILSNLCKYYGITLEEFFKGL